jgi:hypothetical protein
MITSFIYRMSSEASLRNNSQELQNLTKELNSKKQNLSEKEKEVSTYYLYLLS